MKKVLSGVAIGVAIGLAVTFLLAPELAPSGLIPDTTEATKTHVYINGGIVVRGSGEPVELLNNPDATNPTYAELLAFLESDQTDRYTYMLGPPKNAFICTDFAETLHNNAEAEGLRAAFVGIYIEGMDEGHALNAFQTTDRGLVFIDCIGQGLWRDPSGRTRWNRRAFVEVGHPYMVSFLDSFDHLHSAFDFYIHEGLDAERYLRLYRAVYLEEQTVRTLEELGWHRRVGDPVTDESRRRTQQLLEWRETHDIQEINMTWTLEWIRENEERLYSWEWGGEYGHKLRIRADVIQGSWFQPPTWRETVEEKVIVIDEVPVVWHVRWIEHGWTEPFRVYASGDVISRGIVEAIHVHWGE